MRCSVVPLDLLLLCAYYTDSHNLYGWIHRIEFIWVLLVCNLPRWHHFCWQAIKQPENEEKVCMNDLDTLMGCNHNQFPAKLCTSLGRAWKVLHFTYTPLMTKSNINTMYPLVFTMRGLSSISVGPVLYWRLSYLLWVNFCLGTHSVWFHDGFWDWWLRTAVWLVHHWRD